MTPTSATTDPVPPGNPAAGRAHWERTADQLLSALRPYASPGHALVRLPGPASHNGAWSDGLEGFARSFLLAAFRLRGADGADPGGLAEWYAAGLAAGVDPASPERWPSFKESNQAKVEAASVALALHETRPWIWDRLSRRVQRQALDWLGAMVGTDMPQNNWIWFQAVTEAFARGAGGDWRQEDLDRTIALTDEWYAGDGWYSDGLTGGRHRNFDHYNGWAMHLYPLWYCRMLGDAAPPGLLDRYRARLRRFLADQRLLVGANGSPLIQGRSLTYRFAALAPVWTGALFDATPLAPGETRALASRMLGHFTSHGAVDGDGLLTLGWHRPFRPLLQGYSGPASPYWASKGFIGLLLPPDHAVWTERESPLAVERSDFSRTLRAPGWLVSGTASDGVVRVVNHGADHTDPARPHSDDPAYARLAYSTHTAPETPADPAGGPVDSTVTLVDTEGRAAHRRPLERIAVDGATGVSRSRAHWPADERWDPFGGPDTEYRLGPWITVASVLRGPVEIRLVRVDPVRSDDRPGPWRLRLGGWSLPVGARDSGGHTSWDERASAGVTGAGGLWSTVVALRGFSTAETHRATDSNALGAVSATPVLWTEGPVPYGAPLAAAVHLGGDRLRPDQLPRLTVRFEGSDEEPAPGAAVEAEVAWPDGSTDTVRLPAPPPAGDRWQDSYRA
ncbi:DUF2264 domain-containing protein [Streptomyces sp. AK02-01A]|uniref:DUF2264 domain-containing protein n=1 Tax=Streptomyces sp. AK02-01A TaxID=3028648 RepID=UPI0029ACAA8F|nr:DUF2264 domain-containing protein [Streptomyces sp. AK02-01A]MDX3854255.1 DUF2264 domain-containing protein [Streptomyces sp. AK02-01A]